MSATNERKDTRAVYGDKQDWSRYTYAHAREHQRRRKNSSSNGAFFEMKIVGYLNPLEKVLDVVTELECYKEFPAAFLFTTNQKKIEAFATAKKCFIEWMASDAVLMGYDVEVYLRPK